MKNDSALTRMTPQQEKMHEYDKQMFPDRHQLTQDSYSREETQDMCLRCADHYEWNKKLVYSAQLNRYFLKEMKND